MWSSVFTSWSWPTCTTTPCPTSGFHLSKEEDCQQDNIDVNNAGFKMFSKKCLARKEMYCLVSLSKNRSEPKRPGQ